MKTVVCYLLVRGRNFQNEWYESASHDTRRRAKELRQAGFTVTVSAMGEQVTSAGRLRMTLLSVINPGDREIPNPDVYSHSL